MNDSEKNGLSVQTENYLVPQSLAEAEKLADILSGSSMVPDCYKNEKGDTLVALMMGQSLGLSPLQSLQEIAVINGKPSLYGDSPLGLVLSHPDYESHDEGFDEDSMTAWFSIKRRNNSLYTYRFSKGDADLAGLWDTRKDIPRKGGNGTYPNPSPWYRYPKRMLAMRARGFALRNKFPDALKGIGIGEEQDDIARSLDVTDRGSHSTIIPEAEPVTASKAVEGELSPEKEDYPEDRFEENFPKWEDLILSGKKRASEIILMISTKHHITDDQADKIMAIGE